MLPDLPSVKSEIELFLNRYVEMKVNLYSTGISEVPRQAIHEGKGSSILRPTGEKDDTPLHKFEHHLEIEHSSVCDLGVRDVLKRLDEMAKSIADDQEKHFFKTILESTQRKGQVDDGRPQRVSPHSILRALDKIQLEFDEKGEFRPLTVFSPEALSEDIQAALRELTENPEWRKLYDELIIRKREEWRVREASRKLAG